jgi:ubiquinone/menaquinone biosynthesis C-methylase UbiE
MSPPLPIVDDELELLASLVPLAGRRLIELGCGNARLARALLERFPDAELTGLEVDPRQHAKNLAAPQDRLHFVDAGAEAIPAPDASFDGAIMLKSLHHVPMPRMAQALAEIGRVLVPGGWLYVSEPVYDGALNEIARLFNDEGVVRAAAQRALNDALASGRWEAAAERRFATTAHFADFDDFEQRMMRPSWAEHAIDDALLARVRAAFEPHVGPEGASFTRPMHVRLLRRRP